MPELKIDQNQKTIELPKYNQHVLDGVLQRIEREKEHIKRLLVQIFYKIQNADHIIFVARQGVPIAYALQAMYQSKNIKQPKFTVITTSSRSSDKNANSLPVYPKGEEKTIHEILATHTPGKKFFVDDIESNGFARQRLISLAEKLDPQSSYEFLTLYEQSDRGLAVPWDLKIESGGVLPVSANFISASQHLSLAQTVKYRNIEAGCNIVVPENNPNNVSQEMARQIAIKMHQIGTEASTGSIQ